MSIPAHATGGSRTHRHLSEGVTHPDTTHDPARLIAAAATNPAVSDRALRVYTICAAVYDREVDAVLIAATIPSLTEPQAARLLGDLVSAGLLTKRLRTVGYKDNGLRIRRSAYRLVGGEC